MGVATLGSWYNLENLITMIKKGDIGHRFLEDTTLPFFVRGRLQCNGVCRSDYFLFGGLFQREIQLTSNNSAAMTEETLRK